MDRYRGFDGHCAGGTERNLYIFGGSDGRSDIHFGGESGMREFAGIDELRIQSGVDCSRGGTYSGDAYDIDVWTEPADTVRGWNGRGDSSNQEQAGKAWRPSTSRRSCRRVAILRACMDWARGSCGNGAK
jgi:hypothetical protein